MLYAIKSDTLFFNRQANRCDIEAFSYLYPLADPNLIRKMEGAEITKERLDLITRATQSGRMVDQIFSVFLGEVPRDDAIPYVADFFLQLENVRWTLVSGIVNGSFVMSVRNLGYSRNAGDFVRRYFVDIGSAGGHRAMAKAIVPLEAFQARFGAITDNAVGEKMADLLQEFLHEAPDDEEEERTRRKPLNSPHDRLDEQPVRVLVSPIHQLSETLIPIRSLVVGAAEIERANGVVRRLNQEYAVEIGPVRGDGVANG